MTCYLFSTMHNCQDKLLNCRITLSYLSASTKTFLKNLPMKITICLNSAIQAQLIQIYSPVLLLSVNISTRNLVHVNCSVCTRWNQKNWFCGDIGLFKYNQMCLKCQSFATFSILLKLSLRRETYQEGTHM